MPKILALVGIAGGVLVVAVGVVTANLFAIGIGLALTATAGIAGGYGK